MAPRSQRSWSMHPILNDQVSKLLEKHGISFKLRTVDEPEKAINSKVIDISGSFICEGAGCKKTAQDYSDVKATIREYPRSSYSVKVSHKPCSCCGKLNKPMLDSTYEEGVAECIRSWKKVSAKTNAKGSAKRHRKERETLSRRTEDKVFVEMIINERFSIYPELHEQVQDALKDPYLSYSFHQTDDDVNCVESFETKVCGVFICKWCKGRRWRSGTIATVIRLYSDDSYNARVYHQHCKVCECTCRPELDSSYSERVSRRLKIWSGVYVEPVQHESKVTRPHDERRCEGCLNGLCQMRFLQF